MLGKPMRAAIGGGLGGDCIYARRRHPGIGPTADLRRPRLFADEEWVAQVAQPSTKRPAKGLAITAMPTARTTGRGAVTTSSEKIVSRTVMSFRISTIASASRGP